ncbi:cysteine dioxygenase [Aquimarina hainanensis]|uniref:Cysteine dioxygenase n=1 Tax=Aquimarina hainanensis TaxID=1578017 RepID=A0ABW5N6P9_9FLAO|nr:cysteine dioxygenase family protein [Aquimarina sp. TRL1]QKX05908.1 cysteine dioxygenase family protein [Aquimarina sp. TRL1]
MASLSEIKAFLDNTISNPNFESLKSLQHWYQETTLDNWQNKVTFEDASYKRISLIKSHYYDLLLLCWKPGQKSPIHGHPKQGCLVKIMEGNLSDEITTPNQQITANTYFQNDVLYIADNVGQHRVFNISDKNVVSLHLYAPGGYTPDM